MKHSLKHVFEVYKGFAIWKSRENDQGAFEKMLDALLERVEYSSKCHSRVMATMFTVTFPTGFHPEKPLELFRVFCRDLIKTLRRYKFDPHYICCVERSQSLDCHLHIFLLLNADHLKAEFNVWRIACNVWSNKLNLPVFTGYVVCGRTKRYRMLIRNSDDYQQQKEEIIKWGSYLAKVETKIFDEQNRPIWDRSALKRGKRK